MATLPLDLESLVKELPPNPRHQDSAAIAEGTRVGHVHLKVTDLQRSIMFYRNVLGLELMRYLGSAAFLSVARYHHHIGMNTWESLGGPPTQKTWMGMNYFVLTIPEQNLNDLSSRLGGSLGVSDDDSKQLFVSDPDEINLVFRAPANRPNRDQPHYGNASPNA